MRLMTHSFDLDGLIAIEEADETAPQKVIFTIPVDRAIWENIGSSIELQQFFHTTKIGANIFAKGEKRNVVLEYEKKEQSLSLFYSGEKIKFIIDPQLNLKKVDFPKSKSFFERLLYLLRSIVRSSKFRIRLYKKNLGPLELKYKYVGKEFDNKFKDYKFIVLSLESTEELDRLFQKHKVFIIN